MILGRRRERGQALVFVIIILAILGGAWWWLSDAKQTAEQGARAFAVEVGRRLAIDYDAKFLNAHLSPAAELAYTTSFRARLFEHLRRQGKPAAQMPVTGKVEFKSYFFQPRGQLRVELDYASAPAFLDLAVSYPNAQWQIDGMNFTWTASPD